MQLFTASSGTQAGPAFLSTVPDPKLHQCFALSHAKSTAEGRVPWLNCSASLDSESKRLDGEFLATPVPLRRTLPCSTIATDDSVSLSVSFVIIFGSITGKEPDSSVLRSVADSPLFEHRGEIDWSAQISLDLIIKVDPHKLLVIVIVSVSECETLVIQRGTFKPNTITYGENVVE